MISQQDKNNDLNTINHISDIFVYNIFKTLDILKLNG